MKDKTTAKDDGIAREEIPAGTITLEEMLKGRSAVELRRVAVNSLDLADAGKKTRDELAALISQEVAKSPDQWIALFISMIDSETAEVVRRMVDEGSQTLSSKAEDEKDMVDILKDMFLIDCRTWSDGKRKGCCQFTMPEEIRDFLRENHKFDIYRMTGEIIAGVAASAANLYGVVSFNELQALANRYMDVRKDKSDRPLFDVGYVEEIVRGREYDFGESYFTWNGFVCHPEFWSEKEHRKELLDLFTSERDKHGRLYPVDLDEFLAYEFEDESFRCMPECERLETFLSERGLADEGERSDALFCAVRQLQLGTVRPGLIMNGVLEKCTISTSGQADEFCRLWMDFANNLHRRSLNGQTPTMAMRAHPQAMCTPPAFKVNPRADVGRNDPCPCGSGKKFKHCCGKKARKREAENAVASERLSVYLPMRELQMRFVSKRVMPLCDSKMFAAAVERIGIMQDIAGWESNIKTISSVVGDYVAMMDDQFGIPPIKRLLADPGNISGDMLRALEMYRQYRYTWLEVLDAEPGVGLKCRDLLTGEELFFMETSLSRSFVVRELTLCVGVGQLPNGTWMALGAISPAGFDKPEVVLRLVLSHLGISFEPPIRLSFADQARFAAETIKRISNIGRYNDIEYGGIDGRSEGDS